MHYKYSYSLFNNHITIRLNKGQYDLPEPRSSPSHWSRERKWRNSQQTVTKDAVKQSGTGRSNSTMQYLTGMKAVFS